MISISNKAMCCGCATCEIVCPTNAISMMTDEIGFVFPKVDNNACINCGLCEKSCPVLNHKNEKDLNHSIFVTFAKDKEIRFNGSSGGMFGLIAKHIIEEGGVVYGAAFDDNLKLKCTCATTLEELYPIYKSKYLQSDLEESFERIKNQLDSGIKVMFVSTPCQVCALKLFLNKEYQNLLTVDFVCHGVPSQWLFDKCKDYVEKKKNIRVLDYSFRSKKKNGSTPHYYTVKYEKQGKIREKTALYIDSPFYYGFQKYITLRDSCYDCQFSYSNRVSDITIGDFHEVDKYIKGINRFDGVSSFIVNTQKGQQIWSLIKNHTVFHELDFKTLVENGELMCGGTQKPKSRDEFVKTLENEEFEAVVDKYLNGKKQWTKRIYYSLPNIVRKIMKRVMIK